MKKYILAFILSAAVLLCSGCSNSEENSELDELINELPTMYLDGGSEGPEDAKPSYKSITGTVTAVSKKNITVKTGDKEYKVATDKNPQIFGGTIEKELTVTVTYESTQDEEKTITPATITILDGNPEITVSEEETEPIQKEANTEATEVSAAEASDTGAEAISESLTETEAETATQKTAQETSETNATAEGTSQAAAETAS